MNRSRLTSFAATAACCPDECPSCDPENQQYDEWDLRLKGFRPWLAEARFEGPPGQRWSCPDQERFRHCHGLTMQAHCGRSGPMPVAPGVTAWACSGTPSDCVKLALGAGC